MARKNDYGKFILSASEVGAYTVCPESWRLRVVEKVSTARHPTAEKGQVLHGDWAKNYDEAVYLSRGVRIVVTLIMFTILLLLLKHP